MKCRVTCAQRPDIIQPRRYVLRRTKQDFRAHREDANASGFIKEAKDALEVVKRQAVVYSMYARKHKSIMVRGSALFIYMSSSKTFELTTRSFV